MSERLKEIKEIMDKIPASGSSFRADMEWLIDHISDKEKQIKWLETLVARDEYLTSILLDHLDSKGFKSEFINEGIEKMANHISEMELRISKESKQARLDGIRMGLEAAANALDGYADYSKILNKLSPEKIDAERGGSK